MKALETKELLLDVICSSGGGVDIHEAMKRTGLTYKEVESGIHRLIGQGYEIKALPFGVHKDRYSMFWIKRIYLSPYDSRYDQLINA